MSEYGWLWLCTFVLAVIVAGVMLIALNLGKAIGL